MTDDLRWMEKAVRLAAEGRGATYPNPSVGAVVVAADGSLVGSGRSAPTGGPHAEAQALRQAGGRARGGTIYVTLEPCCHVGRTGPCTTAILAAGVARVVVGVEDPAAHVNGQGIVRLREAGVRVDVGVLGSRCAEVHEHYLFHVRHRRPFVTLKSAASLDGRIATRTGESRWITGEAARTEVHRLRAEHHAVAVGVGTVFADDPRLDVRHVEGTSPRPIVFDTHLRLGGGDGPLPRIACAGTLVIHGDTAPELVRQRLVDVGVELLAVRHDPATDRVSLPHALQALGGKDIRSVLVEGGGELLATFVRHGLWERWYYFVAPCLLGGDARAVLPGPGAATMAGVPRLVGGDVRRVGDDLLWILAPPGEPHPAR